MKPAKRVASAPAKVILFGEHFVVYGTPAILAAIDRRTTARAQMRTDAKIVIKSDIGLSAEYVDAKMIRGSASAKVVLGPIHDATIRVLHANRKNAGIQIDLTSQIPRGVGLGSSAASCVSSIAAVDSLFGSHKKKWICEMAIESERMIHRNSSGADCYVSTFGGVMRYGRDSGYKSLKVKGDLNLVISNTGIPHSTGDLVERVRKFREANSVSFNGFEEQARKICDDANDALLAGNLRKLGQLMIENQALLKKIGVSHRKAEVLIDLSIKGGALGAKITGAGGGGAVIALAPSRKEGEKIASLIAKAGYESFEAQIDHEGLMQ